MSEPWDPFPLPTHGDDNKEATFQGVGMVMTQWEWTESRLARLYTVFVGNPDGMEALHKYGSGRIFNERLKLLADAALRFFVRYPNQLLEGIFNRLLIAATEFSARRNEVAHGIVYPIHSHNFFKGKFTEPVGDRKHFALIPPLYLLRKNDAHGNPAYAYTSHELEALAGRLFRLAEEVNGYRIELVKSTEPPAKPH